MAKFTAGHLKGELANPTVAYEALLPCKLQVPAQHKSSLTEGLIIHICHGAHLGLVGPPLLFQRSAAWESLEPCTSRVPTDSPGSWSHSSSSPNRPWMFAKLIEELELPGWQNSQLGSFRTQFRELWNSQKMLKSIEDDFASMTELLTSLLRK